MCDKADVRQRTALLEEAEYYGIQSLIDRLKIDNSCLEFDGVDDYVDLGVFPTLPVYVSYLHKFLLTISVSLPPRVFHVFVLTNFSSQEGS